MKERFAFLDGLRGWAALIVLLIHTFFGSLPAFNRGILHMEYWWPFGGFYAVAIFFVVSGYALSVSFLRSGDRNTIVRITAGRYVRLVIPIFAVCAAFNLMLSWGFVLPPDEIIPSYSSYFKFDPTIGYLFRFVFYDLFFAYTDAGSYAGPLWTISYELFGSFMIGAILYIFGSSRYRLLINFILFLVLLAIDSYYSMFIVGVCLAEINGRFTGDKAEKLGLAALVAGWALPLVLTATYQVQMLATALFVTGVVLNTGAKSFFSNRFSRFLGTFSFPIYLVHAPVIVIIGIPIYIYADGVQWLMFLSDGVVVVMSFLIGMALIPVNDFAMRVSRWFGIHVVNFLQKFNLISSAKVFVPVNSIKNTRE